MAFTNETESGWQQALFPTPIQITANTTYVVSYFSPQGHYSYDSNYFASSGVDNAPLHALSDSLAGGNGVYRYGPTGGFPADTYQANNYWVDVVFTTALPDTTPPTVASFSPAAGANNVSAGINVTVTFSEAMDAASVNGATVELRDPSNALVSATVSYNAATFTATLDPTASLSAGVTYTARVRGGGTDPRVKDVAGNALAADLAWTFTTASGGLIPLDGLANLSYDAANNRINTQGFEYDPAGNQTRAVVNAGGTQQQYRYDCAGRLAQVLDANGATLATHSYGASNQRLVSVEGGVTIYFAWEGGRIIAEYEASGTNALVWKMSYVYMGGRLLATEQPDGIRYHHADRLGTRLVTDASDGAVISEQLTMPFGTQVPYGSTLGGDNSWQHPGRSNLSKKRFTSYDQSDATGLHYAVNRFYSSQQGRFAQVDPIGMAAVSLGNPQSMNLYSYVQNNPVNFVDPTGLFFEWIEVYRDGQLCEIRSPFTDIYADLNCRSGGGGPSPLIDGGGGGGGGQGGTGELPKQKDQQKTEDKTKKASEELENCYKGVDEAFKGKFPGASDFLKGAAFATLFSFVTGVAGGYINSRVVEPKFFNAPKPSRWGALRGGIISVALTDSMAILSNLPAASAKAAEYTGGKLEARAKCRSEVNSKYGTSFGETGEDASLRQQNSTFVAPNAHVP